MMKYIIVFIFTFFIFSTNSIGQVKDTLSQPKIFKMPKAEFSIDIALRFPVGAFGDEFHPNPQSPNGGIVESMEGSRGGMGAEMGFKIGITGNYFFDKRPANFNTGIRISPISFSGIPFNWKSKGDYIFNKGEYSNLYFITFAAGIVFRIAAAENNSFLIYNQFGYTYSWNGGMKYDYKDIWNTTRDHVFMNLNSGSGFCNETGISFRMSDFVMGAGFSFGKIKYSHGELSRDYSAYGYPPINFDLEFSAKMPASTLILSVGYGF